MQLPAFLSPLPNPSFSGTQLSPSSTSPTTPLYSPPILRTPMKAVAEPPTQTFSETFDKVVMNTYVRFPIAMSHGSGARLFSTDGREFLDCVAGIATCTLGHAHPAVISAVNEQMRKLTHVSNLYYIPEQGNLAAWLVQNSCMDKVFFCNSGGEANEAAIKLARKRWHMRRGSTGDGIPVIITAKRSFHGRTLATLTATGQEKYHKDYWPLVEGFDYVEYNDAEDMRRLAQKHGRNLAAVMLEALQGEGGIHKGSEEFCRAARDVCDENGAMLIFDEVQVGVGRTGKLWGFEHLSVEPDVFTLAKGLGGGVPIGATLCKNECDVFAPGDHASTFGGNPLASAAGLAIGRELLEGGVLKNAKIRGEQLGMGLESLKEKYGGVIKEVRGLGLIRGVDLTTTPAAEVVKAAMKRGLLLVPAGKTVVRFVPPLVITEEQVNVALDKFEQALNDVVTL